MPLPVNNADRSPIPLWDAYWTSNDIVETASPIVNKIAELLGSRIRNARVLEIGAGSGRDIIELSVLGAEAHANDKSTVAQQSIVKHATARKAQVVVNGNDLRQLDYPDDFFEVVYSQGVLEHFQTTDDVIAEQLRVTRTGGYVIVDVPQTFNPYTLYKHAMMLLGRWQAGWEREFSPRDLRELGKRHHLSIVELYGWGEHSKLTQPVLGILDRSPWTATCVGAIYRKS